MSHDRNETTRSKFSDPLNDLDTTIHALEGLEVLIEPNADIGERQRDQISFLLSIVIDRFKTSATALREEFKTLNNGGNQ